MCGRQNVRATARDNTGQKTDEGHTPSPSIEIKFSGLTGHPMPAAGLEGTYCMRVIIMYNFLHSPLYELELVRHVSNRTPLLSSPNISRYRK